MQTQGERKNRRGSRGRREPEDKNKRYEGWRGAGEKGADVVYLRCEEGDEAVAPLLRVV